VDLKLQLQLDLLNTRACDHGTGIGKKTFGGGGKTEKRASLKPPRSTPLLYQYRVCKSILRIALQVPYPLSLGRGQKK